MRLFISYAHVDKAIVKEWIVDNLVAGGHDVWFDERLTLGQDWQRQLDAEIGRSQALVYCMTPESVESRYCRDELDTAARLGKPVVPVLLQAQTPPPESLLNLQYVDFSDGPTGDVVARLMGGLQQLAPLSQRHVQEKLPPIPEYHDKKASNPMIRLLGHPAVQGLIGIIGIVIAIIALGQSGGGGTTPTVTPTIPATPIVIALRDLDIRSGPGSNFDRLNILPVDDSLDVLGISSDRLWYQVLLRDGRTGWVLASESATRLNGDRGVVQVIVPTVTPSYTPTDTPAPTNTPTLTLSPTPTHSPTVTDMPSPTPSATHTLTAVASLTDAPTTTQAPLVVDTPEPTLPVSPIATMESPTTAGAYPCSATLNVPNPSQIVRSQPRSTAPTIDTVYPDQIVIIQEEQLQGTRIKWFRVTDEHDQPIGWIEDRYLSLSDTCPY